MRYSAALYCCFFCSLSLFVAVMVGGLHWIALDCPARLSLVWFQHSLRDFNSFLLIVFHCFLVSFSIIVSLLLSYVLSFKYPILVFLHNNTFCQVTPEYYLQAFQIAGVKKRKKKKTCLLFADTSQNALRRPCSTILYCNALYAVSCIIGHEAMLDLNLDKCFLIH